MSELTRGRSGRWLLVAVVLAMLAAVAVLIPVSSASGVVPTTVQSDAGVILLSTGPDAGDNWISYYEDTGTGFDVDDPKATQSIDLSRCNVSLSGANILTIEGAGGNSEVAMVSNGLGVKDKGNCSRSQGQVSDDESLTFALGAYFVNGEGIEFAEVDVEAKHNANLGYELDNGTAGTVNLPNSSDNGPDAGAGDNNIAQIPGGSDVTSIEFKALGSSSNAAVAIEGGGDGQVIGDPEGMREDLNVNLTLFKLVVLKTYDAGDLDCGDGAEGPTSEVEGPATEILLGRGENLKGDACVEVAYSFRIETNRVLFDADLTTDNQENANFMVRIDWDPIADPVNPPTREVNFFPDDSGSSYVPIVACVELHDEGPTIIDPDPDYDDVYIHPMGEPGGPFDGVRVPWCLAGEHLVLDGDEWIQIQWFDGAGDPSWR